MTEVFKTNVNHPSKANVLQALIQNQFPGYAVNFDLDDCDRILRVQSSGSVDPAAILQLMRDCGFSAEVLPDELPAGLSEPSLERESK